MNRVDCLRAQDLLLKLVQALSPLVEETVSGSHFLSQRFFIPPAETHFRRPVQVLTALNKQVEEFIGEVPEDQRLSLNGDQPIAKQAKKLISQVQDTIGKLCTSTHMKDPKEEPLREALKRLKPNLEKIIEAVAQEGDDSAGEGSPSPFRHPLPPSPMLERRVLPAVPFTPENRTLTPARKKKKRKGFWFRKEEEWGSPP